MAITARSRHTTQEVALIVVAHREFVLVAGSDIGLAVDHVGHLDRIARIQMMADHNVHEFGLLQ